MSQDLQGASEIPDANKRESQDGHNISHSPIEERHIDFLLEEEFSCNPDFLHFFLKEARKNMLATWNVPGEADHLIPNETWKCTAVRSVTTTLGETDVLVIYQSADSKKHRVAILIEDKLRAGFQKDQAKRYRDRGTEEAKQEEFIKLWDSFFTCLVAPQKYGNGNAGFDTRISLETIQSFFSAEDQRTKFKAAVLQRALNHFSAKGVQKIDDVMTKFRAFYAHEAEVFFALNEVEWDDARDAWWGDSWFTFRLREELSKGVTIVYKPEMGSVELTFPNTSVNVIDDLLAECSDSLGVIAKPMKKSAAFCVRVDLFHDFSNPEGVRPIILDSLAAVRKLLALYAANKALLNAKPGTEIVRKQTPDQETEEPEDKRWTGDRWSDDPHAQVIENQCQTCARRIGSSVTCEAFPKGIPVMILMGIFDHTYPYSSPSRGEDDEGLTYVPKDE